MIGGGDYITPTRQYTWYGSGKQPAKYMLPTTLYKSLKNPLMMVLGRAIYYSQNPKPESTSILKEFPWKKHHYQPEEWGFFKGFPQNNQKCLILSSPTTGVGIKTMILADVKKLNKKNTWKAQVTVHWWVVLPQLPLLIWVSTLEVGGPTSLVFLFGWGSNPYVSTWVKLKNLIHKNTPVN